MGQLTPVVIQSWFWYRGKKNTRKRPKHFAIYLDKTLLIPVRVAGCGKMSGWLMFMAGKKLGQGLSGHWSTGLHHQDKMIRDVLSYFPVFALNLSPLSQGNLVINLVWCLDIWLTPIMSCVRYFTPDWDTGRVLVQELLLLTFYPIIQTHRPENGLKSTILNLPFLTWLQSESTKITMAMHDTKVACFLTSTTKSILSDK